MKWVRYEKQKTNKQTKAAGVGVCTVLFDAVVSKFPAYEYQPWISVSGAFDQLLSLSAQKNQYLSIPAEQAHGRPVGGSRGGQEGSLEIEK